MTSLELADVAVVKVGLAVLLIWWGTWTLLDLYLIPFSPWAEIALILFGLLLMAIPASGGSAAELEDVADLEEEEPRSAVKRSVKASRL